MIKGGELYNAPRCSGLSVWAVGLRGRRRLTVPEDESMGLCQNGNGARRLVAKEDSKRHAQLA